MCSSDLQYTFGEVDVETALDKLSEEGLKRAVPFQDGELFRGDQIENTIDTLTYAAGIAGYAFVDRSEERRVGKECRSRWSPYH